MTIIDVTSPDPLSRALCIICISDIDYILLILFFTFYLLFLFIYFLLLYLFTFMSFRDVQELGGGVVFPCGSISALVVPARHVR